MEKIRLIEVHNRFVAVRLNDGTVINELEVTNTRVPNTDVKVGEVIGIDENGNTVSFLTSDVKAIQFLDTKDQAVLRNVTEMKENFKNINMDELPQDNPLHEMLTNLEQQFEELQAKGVTPYQNVRG